MDEAKTTSIEYMLLVLRVVIVVAKARCQHCIHHNCVCRIMIASAAIMGSVISWSRTVVKFFFIKRNISECLGMASDPLPESKFFLWGTNTLLSNSYLRTLRT